MLLRFVYQRTYVTFIQLAKATEFSDGASSVIKKCQPTWLSCSKRLKMKLNGKRKKKKNP